MKKLIIFPLIALFITAFKTSYLPAQTCEGPAILIEPFNSDTIPAGWTVLAVDTNAMYPSSDEKGYTGQWQAYNHFGRQCMTNCSRFADGAAAPDDYLVTPLIHLGAAPVCLSWKSARAFDDFTFNNEEYDVLVSLSGSDLTDFAGLPPVFTVADTSAQWKDYSIDLSAFAGQDVNIGFWHRTPGFGYALYIDDIRVGQPVNLDAKISEIRVQDMVTPGTTVPIEGTLYNGGLSTISTADINWNINNGPVNIYSLPAFSLAPQGYLDFSLPATWNAPANGTFLVKVWSANPNGMTDMYADNDTLIRYIFVSTHPRKVLQEEFTQASCPPCATYNPAYDSLLDSNRLAGKITTIKYHVGWPGFDPMFNLNPSDAIDRVMYTGVTGVPEAAQDGKLIDACPPYNFPGFPPCLDQQQIDSAFAVPSLFNINITTSVSGADYQVNYQVEALSDFPLTSFRVFAALMEENISFASPPGTNGELDFPFVMRKMLPNADGVPLPPLTAGQIFTQSLITPILPDYLDFMLRVVVFVEDNSDKRVYQSEMTDQEIVTGFHNTYDTETGIRIFPVPATDNIFVAFENAGPDYSYIITNLLGEEIQPAKMITTAGRSSAEIDISRLDAGIYFLKVTGKESTSTKKFIKN